MVTEQKTIVIGIGKFWIAVKIDDVILEGTYNEYDD